MKKKNNNKKQKNIKKINLAYDVELGRITKENAQQKIKEQRLAKWGK